MNIGRGALLAQQKGLDVTGHNIANVNTPGYTRQVLVLQSSEVTSLNRLKLGYGVNADSVTQYFDRFTTKNINQKTSSLSQYETEKSTLDYVQGLFNEATENGLNKVTADFWNAWQDLSNNPAGMAERTALLEKAQNMVQQFQGIRNGLTQTKDEMNLNLKGGIEEINTLDDQIAKLNERIVEAEAGGTKANDLRDQRNNLIQNLSQLTDITYLEKDNGALTVMTKSGIALVEGNLYWTLSQQGDNIYWNNITSDISNQLTGGKIGAWLDLRDNILPQYMANMDELAGTMIQQVNNLHYNGYTSSGETGQYFFDPISFTAVLNNGAWTGTSTRSVGGAYASTAPAGIFNFTVTSANGTVGTDAITLGWTGPGGTSGTVNFNGAGPDPYVPGTMVNVSQGLQISLGAGTVVNGQIFSITVSPNFTDSAKTIALSSDVADTPSNIAASQISDPTETGNNQNALAIQALQDEQLPINKWTYQNRGGIQSSAGQLGTMDEYYNILVGDIGLMDSQAGQNRDLNQSLINQLNELRDSVSGVSLDEEMVNMMKYQYAFIAASKIITASSELMQAVLAMRS
jgi:flagellar hook-associated protein 1 FlgK